MKKTAVPTEKVLVSFLDKPECSFYNKYYDRKTTLGKLMEVGTVKNKPSLIHIFYQNIQYLKSIIYHPSELDILYEFDFKLLKLETEDEEIYCNLAYCFDKEISKKNTEIMEVFSSEELCIGLGLKYHPKTAKFCLGWAPFEDSFFVVIEDKRNAALTNLLTLNELLKRTYNMSALINDILVDLNSEFVNDVQFFPNPYHYKMISTLRNINLNQLKN
jgi:hypothetical protein